MPRAAEYCNPREARNETRPRERAKLTRSTTRERLRATADKRVAGRATGGFSTQRQDRESAPATAKLWFFLRVAYKRLGDCWSRVLTLWLLITALFVAWGKIENSGLKTKPKNLYGVPASGCSLHVGMCDLGATGHETRCSQCCACPHESTEHPVENSNAGLHTYPHITILQSRKIIYFASRA